MAATISESYEERQVEMNQNGNCTEYGQTFVVSDASDEYAAAEAVRENVPVYQHNLPLQSVETCAKCGDTCFKVRVRYAATSHFADSDDEDVATMSFNCGAGSRHVVRSLQQTRIYGDTDAGGLINWNGKLGKDRAVAGVDVPFPLLRTSYTKKMRLSAMTSSYIRNAAALVGCVNLYTWKGWNSGEVMFLGWSYAAPVKGAKTAAVTYSFGIRMNETITISGTTVTYLKKGYDYIWSLMKPQSDGTGTRPAIDSVYVEQVAKYADFSILGI